MDSSLKVQLDIRNNSEDLQKYFLDLKDWEKEMKRKEESLRNKCDDTISDFPVPRNKKKKEVTNIGCKPAEKKISGSDYLAWEKYDADKACEDIVDCCIEEEKVEKQREFLPVKNINQIGLSQEKKADVNLVDKAFYEKDLGNRFVKQGNWSEAVKCYSKAIDYDPTQATYYANRGLCFLKLKDFKSSETDSTTALQLDPSYLKAYQRRALARSIMGQLKEAKSDYEKILELEPNNKDAEVQIEKINKKISSTNTISLKSAKKETIFDPKKIFQEKKLSDQMKSLEENQISSSNKGGSSGQELPVDNKISSVFKRGSSNQDPITTKELPVDNKKLDDGPTVHQIFPVNKPPHLRSKKPLKRITVIEEITKLEPMKTKETATVVSSSFEVVNSTPSVSSTSVPEIPKNSVQFLKAWNIVRTNPTLCHQFLKQISLTSLPTIFQDSMDFTTFSDIICVLSKEPISNEPDFVYSMLLTLSKIKRFSSLIMFMSNGDKTSVRKCLDIVKNGKNVCDESHIEQVKLLYEL